MLALVLERLAAWRRRRNTRRWLSGFSARHRRCVRLLSEAMVEQALATARSILGEEAFAAVWAEAQSLSVEQILNGLPSAAAFTAVRDRSET